MKKFLNLILISLVVAACVPATQTPTDTSKLNSTTSVDDKVDPSVDTQMPPSYVALNPSSATTVHVIQDGKGLCNSGAFSQLPDNKDYFIGRMLITTSTTNMCEGTNWQLALFKMDWANNVLNFQKAIISIPVKGSNFTITSAYDPYIIKYNSEYWLAFECYGTGDVFKDNVGACLAPFTIAAGIDTSRLSIPVKGLKVGDDMYSTSVPKLLEFNSSLYLYWTSVHFKSNRISDIGTRGMQLVQELTSQRKIWGVRSGNVPVPTHDPLNVEVLGTNPNDILTNNVADGFHVMAVDNKIIMTAGMGGTGCMTPVSQVFGCYRLQIYRSSSPLGHHVFNSEVMNSQQLAFNPEEYSRIFFDPEGNSFMMGMMVTPFLAGIPAPSHTVTNGFKRYPFDIKNLSFTTNLTSINPIINPVNNVEVVNLNIEVLENFVPTCNKTNTHLLSCRSAITRFCMNHGYAGGGYGPTDQSSTAVNFTCIKDISSSSIITPVANLKKFNSNCVGVVSDSCNSAVNQYCKASGFEAGGFGPGEFDGTNVKLTCIKAPRGYQVNSTLSHMRTYQAACNDSDVNSVACNSATNKFCGSQGYKSTFGILEHVGDAILIGCLN